MQPGGSKVEHIFRWMDISSGRFIFIESAAGVQKPVPVGQNCWPSNFSDASNWARCSITILSHQNLMEYAEPLLEVVIDEDFKESHLEAGRLVIGFFVAVWFFTLDHPWGPFFGACFVIIPSRLYLIFEPSIGWELSITLDPESGIPATQVIPWWCPKWRDQWRKWWTAACQRDLSGTHRELSQVFSFFPRYGIYI